MRLCRAKWWRMFQKVPRLWQKSTNHHKHQGPRRINRQWVQYHMSPRNLQHNKLTMVEKGKVVTIETNEEEEDMEEDQHCALYYLHRATLVTLFSDMRSKPRQQTNQFTVIVLQLVSTIVCTLPYHSWFFDRKFFLYFIFQLLDLCTIKALFSFSRTRSFSSSWNLKFPRQISFSSPICYVSCSCVISSFRAL